MHNQKITNRVTLTISAYIAIFAVAVSSMFLSCPVQIRAQTTTTLYGTGSEDDINIVKLLDMALNKGGLSMSPATIKNFLEFWWDSVKADLNTCINDAGTTITTTTDLIDYCKNTLQNPDAESTLKVPSLTLRYVEFCVKMSSKSISDFKQLITQEGTFREFLLSYVTDENGNIADTVDNKLQKYNIGKSLVNMAREAADKYIEEYEGYYLVPTLTYKDVDLTKYSKKVFYQLAYDSLKTIPDDKLIYYWGLGNICFMDITGYNLVNGTLRNDGSVFVSNGIYNDDWTRHNLTFLVLSESSDSLDFTQDIRYPAGLGTGNLGIYTDFSQISQSDTSGAVFSSDGRTIKIWKSLDAFKASSLGKSNIYYSSDYSKYDASVDNSIDFSGSYYSSNSSSYSHDVIQNNIDNSSEVNESTINNIVNNYITNNNYGDSSGTGSGSGGSGSGSGSNDDWWHIGDGIDAFIKGIAALLDFLLKLIGDLIGLLSSFLTGLLEVMGKIAELGQGFSNFLKAAFGFIPEECISLIVVSVGVMCALGVFKLFKK